MPRCIRATRSRPASYKSDSSDTESTSSTSTEGKRVRGKYRRPGELTRAERHSKLANGEASFFVPKLLPFTRKEILTIDIATFEARINQINDIDDDMIKEIRLATRCIKNRESAAASRRNRKNYCAKLEARIATLEAENALLMKEVRLIRIAQWVEELPHINHAPLAQSITTN
jgi:hypothetical protein